MLVVVKGYVDNNPEMTWNVSTGYSNDDFAVMHGYLRKKDAEIAMLALNCCGIDWDLDAETNRRKVIELFGSRKKWERWVNEHLQW